MQSRRNKKLSKKSKKMHTKKTHTKRKWITAVGSAENVYKESGSYEKAREKLRNESILNARRLFGSVRERLSA